MKSYWSSEQIARIKELWPIGTSVAELCGEFGRTPIQIRMLACRLKLKRDVQQIRQSPMRKHFGPSGKLLAHFSPTEIGYLAGLFDGEGCVDIVTKSRKRTITYYLRVNISNTDHDVMNWLMTKIGYGSVQSSITGKKRRVYRWVASTTVAIMFCAEIFPHLIIKRTQVELVVQNLLNGFSPIPQAKRRELQIMISQLKHL